MDSEPHDVPTTSTSEDRALGMTRKVARRDFLNGLAYTAAAVAAQGMLPWGRAHAGGAGGSPTGEYPPAQANAVVGQTPQANAVMHAIRDGMLTPGAGASTGETFDLVVVGAGISGLAAAHEFRRLHPRARVLILDPLADVGGHAKRNEFRVGGKTMIGYGGSQSLQTPSYFSPAVNALLGSVGIEPQKFEGYYDGEWYDKRGLSGGVYFDPAVWGRAATVVETDKAAEWVKDTPLNANARADLIELTDAPRDYLPGKTAAQKRDLLADTTYRDFLLNIARADPQLVTYFQDSTREYYGSGIDKVGTLDAWANGNPGLDGMELGDQPDRRNSPSGRLLMTDPDDYIYHFPDGNASVARALVRSLIPQALARGDMPTLAVSRLKYAQLDQPGHPVRIRLESSAVRVRHLGDPSTARQVEVTYARGGNLHSVVAGHVVLACWHRVIPYLTRELPEAQVTALRDQVKVPLVYTNVVIRNWHAFKNLGLSAVTAPGHFWLGADLDFPVSMGSYHFARTPDDPVVLHLRRIPGGPPEQDVREQFNTGRAELLGLRFADYERQARRLLNGALGGGGFDAARDIAAITINRWAHGYAYEYMRPADRFWPGGPLPIQAARKGWGKVAIANSDSGAYAYAHSAIDQGVRAAREVLGVSGGPAVSDFPGPPQGKLKFFGG
ncbi:NAD(P)/FAD-dependent oxidoreductase [Deinococcus sp. KSM4-11]|uniref:NAD(P)-binding protein n=1 Tax=Deinococcus sp. KSM4-11 TaxID=2568654 RepID=UPI0010A4BF18|nr:FAD/NAD(P)-binding protein [Deinococcus sp. KSM4-11]THF85323.1 NAD(P)/FAD-dependent oxidoreductase [Deinococcus sp. KSM4-11]